LRKISTLNIFEDLSIPKLRQKVMIDVNEKRTTAVAVTSYVNKFILAPHEVDKVIFNANHPFMFAIKDLRTGILLFVGRYVGE
jgi:serpin B